MLKIILSTFIVVFLAELGDKTQLATMLLSAKSASKLSVFIGASLALICTTIIGVLCGSFIEKHIPKNLLNIISAVVFILIGVFMLIQTKK
ncbi:MAG: TMEM165/GDT1 family protein [Caloramator sp.]|nr:TMEM165/GDT1 family protein [Caloramator sp.]